jgi:hypothetical protein
MKGSFWNIRGLNNTGRKNSLVSLIRGNTLDFVGVVETKNEVCLPSFLDSLGGNFQFKWQVLPASGTAGGTLLGVKDEFGVVSNVASLDFSLSCVVQNRKDRLIWKLVVVYDSPYEVKKVAFIDELHLILEGWQGPIMLGGDFNLCRFSTDKNNGNINQKFSDYFNDWVNKWGLVELDPCNRKFTWSNNQCTLVMAKLDRVFVSTGWGSRFPLAKVTCLPKDISDHTPLLVDSGENCHRGGNRFRFEKWWIERGEFRDLVRKVWDTQYEGVSSLDV